MADKAIYSVDTVTSMSGTDKVYVNTGNNIKQITKDNLCGNDIDNVNNQIDVVRNDVDVLNGEVETLKTEVNNKYIDTFYLGSNSSTTFDISERVKIGYPIMIMLYPIDDQSGIWNYVGVIMPSSLDIHIVTLNSYNIEITMDSNYIITVKNTNADWGTHFKMRLI